VADGIQIERSKHAQEFVIIGNSEARDSRLSFRARGLHHHLLSLPPGWRVTTTQLAADNPEGRDAIRSALNELIACGYVTKAKRQDSRGRWSTVMTVHDKPQPGTDFQAPVTEDGFPGVGKPGVGKPGAKELKTVTENDEDQKMASRRGRASSATANLTDQAKIDGVRQAAIEVYGTDQDVSDGECLALYDFACRNYDGQARKIRSVRAYMGKLFEDAPDIHSLLSNATAYCHECWEPDAYCACGVPAATGGG
jgi:hypothetical protein